MELFTPGHFIILAIVTAFLFFGWKQMPDMARSLGRSLRVFKTEIKGLSGDDKAREDAANAAAQLPPAVAPPAIANTAPAAPAVAPHLTKPAASVRTDAASGAIQADVARSRPRPAPRPTHSDSTAGTK